MGSNRHRYCRHGPLAPTKARLYRHILKEDKVPFDEKLCSEDTLKTLVRATFGTVTNFSDGHEVYSRDGVVNLRIVKAHVV